MTEPRGCQLYLISPPSFIAEELARQLDAALAAVPRSPNARGENLVGAFLLRLEGAEEEVWRQAIHHLQPVCARYGVAFLLNEQVALALDCDADGVNLTHAGTPIKEVRARLGAERIIGVSCLNSRDAAMKAGDAGADYVLFSSFYEPETNLKPAAATPDILAWWQEFFVLPCVAAGGVTVHNCHPLVTAGADFLAVIHAVWNAPEGAGAAVKAFDAAITEALQNL